MSYGGTIDLISGIRAKNNGAFPLVDAKDIYLDDQTRAFGVLLDSSEVIEMLSSNLKKVTSKNILDVSKDNIGISISNNGTEENRSEYNTTGYIRVNSGEHLVLSATDSSGERTIVPIRYVSMYDKNGAVLSDLGYSNLSFTGFDILDGISYIRITYPTNGYQDIMLSVEMEDAALEYEEYFPAYYIATEKFLGDLLNNLANSDTIQDIQKKAVANLLWNDATRELRMVNMSNTAIGEVIKISGGEAGEYDVTYDPETGAFTLTENGEVKTTVTIIGGGGGGGGGSTITIDLITPTSIVSLEGEKTVIQYGFSSVDSDGDPLTGTYSWKIDGAVVQGASGECINGINEFDITSYLTYNDRKFMLTITDSMGSIKTKYWTARKVDVRLESSWSDRNIKPVGKEFGFTYTPYGAGIEKTIHFRLDGVELPSVITSLSAISQEYILPMQTHGAHLLDCWITATVGNANIETPHVYKDVLCVDEKSNVPIIGCINRCIPVAEDAIYDDSIRYYTRNQNGEFTLWEHSSEEWNTRPQLYYGSIVANQYDGVTVTFVVYKPGGGISNVVVTTDGTSRTETTSDLVNTFSYRTAEVGVHTASIKTGTTEIFIIMDIAKINIDITPVTTGLAMDFNPNGYSNGSIDRNSPWVYDKNANIKLTVSDGFDWSNGGFQLDENGNSYFCVKAGHRAYFSYKLFEKNAKPNGAHFKLIFKTQNVRDIDATFLSCLSDNVGLTMNVHSADLRTSTNVLNAPYSEEDIIEFEYNIEPLDTTKAGAKALVMIYEDGTAYRPMEYDDNHRLYQNTNPVGITVGSDDCDVFIYRMVANEASLNDRNVISNFIADALGAEEMIDRYERNQIYDASTGMLTAESLAAACPWLKVIKIECPRFTTNKSDKVPNTNIQCIHKGGDPILDNWYATGAQHSGQGTTSNEYGVAGRNLDLIMNKGAVIITGVADVVNGIPTTIEGSETVSKVTLTRTSVPNAYFNVKVNIASSENANNALLQRRYDRFLPYTPVSKKKNPFAKMTMEFVNCVIFVKETGTGTDSAGNSYTRQEFQDGEWHFYAIGNMGDSKKTDKSRACDPDDGNEFTNEVLDNTLSNSVFDTGVTNLLYASKASLPAVGDLFSDYYYPTSGGKFMLNRYLNGAWTYDIKAVDEIVNGATAIYSSLPATGMKYVDYYVGSEGAYTLYIWNGSSFSEGIERTEVEKTHMATAIAPAQWVEGNVKYDSLMADTFDGDGTYELRYCKDENNIAPHIAVWQNLYKWIVTSTDEEFVSELGDWFIEDAVLYYYLYTERYTMSDNRSKNSFYHWSKVYISEEEAAGAYADVAQYYTIDNAKAAINNGYRFDFWDYDNDTGLGINNSGELKMPYGKEDIDYFDDDVTKGYIFNGAENVLFKRVRLLMHEQLMDMYQSRESAGCWDSEVMIEEFDAFQNQFPEELWRLDVERKYMRPYLGISVDNSIPKTSDRFLKTMLNGRKKYHRRQFERDQSAYMGTKYLSTSVMDDQVMFRCNTPAGVVVAPDYTLTVVPYSDMYLSVKFGNSEATQIRAKAGQSYQVNCPYTTMTDTAVLIYSASRLQELNDLSRCYIHDNDFSNAVKLQKLIIGNPTPGYANAFLERLTIGNNRLLAELNIRNCPNLAGAIDLFALGSLETFDARGTAINAVTFAENGKLKTAYLPDGITALTMKNLNYVETFSVSYDDIEKITVNGGILDTVEIGMDVADTATDIHFGDIDWNLLNTDVLKLLYEVDDCYLAGDITITGSIGDYELENYQVKWNDVVFDISGATVIPYYLVRFLNWDGAVLDKQYVIAGSYAVDPITRENNPIATPTRESTAEFHHTYANWDRKVSETMISANMDFVAVYNSEKRKYTVRWFNGETLLQTKNPYYGESVEYEGDTPKDTSLEANLIYRMFNGWDNHTGFITSDLDVHARYSQATVPENKAFADMTPVELSALIKREILSSNSVNNTLIASGDEHTILLGRDYNYDNVESVELVSLDDPKTFDGTDYYDTGVKLFDIDKSFTLVIDFQFANATNSAVLASCYERNGFSLRQSSGGNILWGTSANVKVSAATDRELVVLRHTKGDSQLYVYGSNRLGNDIIEKALTYSLTTQHEAPLVFGANVQSDGYIDGYGAGTIYWSKIWWADLGEKICQNLACWTREKIVMQAAGSSDYAYRVFRRSDNGRYVNLCMITKGLPFSKRMNPANINEGGWPATEIRTYLNKRIFNALPEQWQMLIASVTVASTSGSMKTDIVSSEDKIFIPSAKEVGLNITSTGYAEESEATFTIFSNNESRIKHQNGIAPYWWLRSPGTGSSTPFCIVYTAGGLGNSSAAYVYGVCFGFCI